MGRATTRKRRAPSAVTVLASSVLLAILGLPQFVGAGEGGTSHILPGANATLLDVLPTSSGWVVKPMYLHYGGSFSAQLPTAVGLAGNVDATANTVVLGGVYTLEPTILGGAHCSFAAFVPYSWLDVAADVQTASGGAARRHSSVNGFGDLTAVPLMLAWKFGDWQIDALAPIYAPTGSYEKGRLGNPGLDYWTFDPMVGVAYTNKALGFNALLHVGYAMNTENPDTHYLSGSLLHLDAAVQQILPVGPGFLTFGLEGFYFQQVTADGGSGASLGSFEGMTTGLGPLLAYILPLGEQAMLAELKWLTELETKKRLDGDYIWVKVAYRF